MEKNKWTCENGPIERVEGDSVQLYSHLYKDERRIRIHLWKSGEIHLEMRFSIVITMETDATYCQTLDGSTTFGDEPWLG